ncbi:flavodoxin domain-containing protein [Sulfitobacter aestuariivivens]|uniref:flavodoxin domain-containing protein n=1 Tax=Sulfitobacter aestuariivivens TaxID=2766981 RepID=UPI0036237C44
MNVLILFESVEGQTQKIATFVADEVSKLGHTSTLANAEETAAVTFDSVDAVILAAPVHQRRHPENSKRCWQALWETWRSAGQCYCRSASVRPFRMDWKKPANMSPKC